MDIPREIRDRTPPAARHRTPPKHRGQPSQPVDMLVQPATGVPSVIDRFSRIPRRQHVAFATVILQNEWQADAFPGQPPAYMTPVKKHAAIAGVLG